MSKDFKRPNLGGSKLKKFIKENKLKQNKFNDDLGLPSGTLTKFIIGTRVPNEERRKMIKEKTNEYVIENDWDVMTGDNSIEIKAKNKDKQKKLSVNFDRIKEFYTLKQFYKLLDDEINNNRISKISVYNWYKANYFPSNSWTFTLQKLDPRLKVNDWNLVKVAEAKNNESEESNLQKTKTEDKEIAPREKYKESAEQKIKDYLNKLKNNTEFSKFSKETKTNRTIIIQNKPDAGIKDKNEVRKRDNLISFKDIRLVKGDCKSCIFYGNCLPTVKPDCSSSAKSIILKMTNDNCSIGYCYKYKEHWIQALPENIKIGITVRRKSNLEQCKVIETINTKKYKDVIIIENSSGEEVMTKCVDFEVLRN